MRFKKKQESLLPPVSPARLFESFWELKPLTKKICARGHLLRDTIGTEEGEGLVYAAKKSDSLVFHIEADLSHSGDGVEIFLDMRPGTSAVVGRFCHCFVFDGSFREKTHFRTPEESHPLCSPELLKWEGTEHGVTLEIPAEALHGWGAAHMGFALRLQSAGKKQHLGVSAKEGSFENHPALWSKLLMES